MQLIIDLPDRDESLAFHRKRWGEVLQDRMLQEHPDRIETNYEGQVIMTPPASLGHGSRQSRISRLLAERLQDQVVTECPLITSDGVKAVDVAWFSPDRYATVRGQLAAEVGPQICCEIASPRNSIAELQRKFKLYFDAGAIECWLCDLDGRMHYFKNADAHTSHDHSELCPNFPNQIED